MIDKRFFIFTRNTIFNINFKLENAFYELKRDIHIIVYMHQVFEVHEAGN